MAKLLVVDDDDLVRDVIATVLTQTGHTVHQAGDGRQALDLFRAMTFDLVLTDIIMPGQDGIETILQLRQTHPAVRIIAMSGGSTQSKFYLEIATRLGAHCFLAKPFSLEELLRSIATVLAAPLPPPPPGRLAP